MDTRKHDIEILRKMQKLNERLDEIADELAQLDSREMDLGVDQRAYQLNTADVYEEEKETVRDAVSLRFQREEKNTVTGLGLLPWAGILAGVGLLVAERNVILAVFIAVAGFVLKSVIKAIVKKCYASSSAKALQSVEQDFGAKLAAAKAADEKEMQRYQEDLESAKRALREELQPRRKELKNERAKIDEEFDEIRIISRKDMENIEDLIDLLEGYRADNIKEALRELDKEKRRQEEERRRREDDDRRREEESRQRIAAERAAEAARKSTMPGRVNIRIGSINMYSGDLKTVRNTIYVDGMPYGAGSAAVSTIQLNPGAHSIYAQLEEAGYIFTSPTHSFDLSGDDDIYLKIMIKNARAGVYECYSRSELMSN